MPINRLLGVWAHPDDEAYLSSGLMARTVRGGGHVTCVTATRGEAGGAPGALRERELRSSLAVAGVFSHHVLGHPDGACTAVPAERAVGQLERILYAIRPDTIVTFGPDGITGHPDHIAVHRWVRTAWARTGIGRLLYAAHSKGFLDEYRALNRSLGVFMGDEPVGRDIEDMAVTVELTDDELDVKRAALAAHASQTDALVAQIGEATYREWVRRENFVAATPVPRALARRQVYPSTALFHPATRLLV
jgi:LmbE family N-acetylglucosaminyl deacetylase